jgi:hypothetical protein
MLACRLPTELQCRHVITLDPKLIDVVWNTKRDGFVFRFDQFNIGKPALETVRANLRLKCSRQLLPQLRAFLVHTEVVNSVTQMPHSAAP